MVLLVKFKMIRDFYEIKLEKDFRRYVLKCDIIR